MGLKILLPLVIFALCLAGCSLFDKENPEQKAQVVKYMEKEQIFAEFKAMKKAKYLQKNEPFTEEDKARLANLINLKDFFPKEKMRNLNNQIKMRPKTLHKDAKEYAPQPQVDLRFRDTSVKSQDNGKCTAYAGVAAIENMLQKDKIIPGLDLSDWDAWAKYGVYSCDSFMTNLTKERNKICEEKYYPQYGKRSTTCAKTANAYITDSQYLGNDINEIVRSLNQGHVVYIGMSTPNDMVKCKNIVNPKNGFANGGHALLIVGYYTDTTMPNEIIAIIKNSWGVDCSDKGYVYMPLSIIKKSGANFGAWEIKSVTSDVKPSDDPTPTPTPECVEWKRVWYAPWKWTCAVWK